ncbi:hypothetical protein HHL16_13530 [Pseudoflavitalea sp. G-6-1-2]|uniref:hypothetical protein n=1 Tax=Pseudoflavitalea sp. G-6-1-2 TaxID=2728841 RepID=UPI00146DEA93|nr:hypothetical protein [Pseudoflavitalea sp. G-6-1-2]NML21905.1 hypothetical protein [Pseudoflavitalea sp. G-6-1-2]
MKQGYCYAASRVHDSSAAGGFAPSDNFPKPADNRIPFVLFAVTLKLFRETKAAPWALYLSNGTAMALELPALDSRLNIIAEAWVDEQWQPVEYLPSITCGNSKHKLVLSSKEYWKFPIPAYEGSLSARIRYKLQLPDGTTLYSNDIAAGINREQLTIREEEYQKEQTQSHQ